MQLRTIGSAGTQTTSGSCIDEFPNAHQCKELCKFSMPMYDNCAWTVTCVGGHIKRIWLVNSGQVYAVLTVHVHVWQAWGRHASTWQLCFSLNSHSWHIVGMLAWLKNELDEVSIHCFTFCWIAWIFKVRVSHHLVRRLTKSVGLIYAVISCISNELFCTYCTAFGAMITWTFVPDTDGNGLKSWQ